MSLTIQLPKFEGPLALLLYLIRKEEMDIFDIKINEITGQYLEYIKLMKELDIEMAGDFIAMAATLIHIKSRMLLPQYDEHGEVVDQEDPRKELVQRLLEYQKYQEAGKSLYERPLLGRDVFARGFREKINDKEDEIVLEENALFALITAYRDAMRSIKKKTHQVKAKTQSVASRILEIKDRLIIGSQVAMSSLIDAFGDRRRQVLITFLSLLELGKMGFISLYQTDTYQEIYIQANQTIETNVLDRVEEYDSMRAEEIAATMMVDAGKMDPTIDFTEEFSEVETPTGHFVMPDEAVSIETEFDDVIAEVELATDEEILAAEKEFEA